MVETIYSHRKYVEDQLAGPLTDEAREELYAYHVDRVHDFQHERLIHLLVTFFFAFLLLASVTALLLVTQPELRLPLGILSSILLVLELAYIRHYYQLENGVQSLYPLTTHLHEKK